MKSMPKGFRRYDTLDHLKTEADIAAYLEACNEMDDPVLIVDALGLVARARNQSALARDAGISRQGLYKALAPNSNPSFATVQALAKALGLKVTISLAT
jgi:probable addiction module antidote protein